MLPFSASRSRLAKSARFFVALGLAALAPASAASANTFLLDVSPHIAGYPGEARQVGVIVTVDPGVVGKDWYFYDAYVSKVATNERGESLYPIGGPALGPYYYLQLRSRNWYTEAFAENYVAYPEDPTGHFVGEVTAMIAWYGADVQPFVGDVPIETRMETARFEFDLPGPISAAASAVPEPSAAVMAAMAALVGMGLATARRRRSG